MSAEVGSSSSSDWSEVIAEQPNERLHSVEVFRGHVVLQTVRRGRQRLRLLTWDALNMADPLSYSTVVDGGIPGGHITLSHNEEFAADHVLVEVESFVQPLQWQAIDLETGEVSITTRVVSLDEGARPDTTVEGLGKLKTVFAARGSVTAGNSSQTSDGAGALILASESAVKRFGLTPLARFVSFASKGVPPHIMGIGPIEAIPAALRYAGL